MEMHAFKDRDWDGFAGATCWANGDRPLIGSGQMRGLDVLVIADPEGVSVFYEIDEEYFCLMSPHGIAFSSKEAAMRFCCMLTPDCSLEELKGMGFMSSAC